MAAHEFLVAVDDEEILGFAQLDPARGEIVGCYVHPRAHRGGVGSRLLAALVVRAAARGVTELHLDASLNAVAFYQSAGFRADGPRRHRLDGGVDIACIHMRRRLAQ